MDNKEVYTIAKYLVDFDEAWDQTIKSIERVSAIYVDAIKHYPSTARSAFQTAHPEIEEITWLTFEAIGNGKLNAKAFFYKVEIRNGLKELPNKLQSKIFKGKKTPEFKVVNPSTNNVDIVPLDKMSTKQFNLVFDKKRGSVRSVDDQKVVIDHTTNKEEPKTTSTLPDKWKIVGKKVEIGGIRLSLDEIEEIREALIKVNTIN